MKRILTGHSGGGTVCCELPGADQVRNSKERRRFYSAACNRQGRHFETGFIYTFHFWQHLLDLATWKLSIGYAKFDLHRHLNRQPLRLMAQLPGGECLWDFELQHQG